MKEDRNPRLSTDPRGQQTEHFYDSLQRRRQTTQPLPAAGVARPVIQFNWDGLGQLGGVTDPRSLVTTYATDGLGNTTQQASPDTGTTGATYDEAGNLKTRTDARGKTTTYTYDSLNRLTLIDYPTGVDTVFEYDGGTAGAPNAKGRLTKITDESGVTTYSYDGFGRVLTKTQVYGSGTATRSFTNTYAWGAAGAGTGKLESITYPSGARVNYTYDATGRVSAITINPVNTNGVGTSATVRTLLNNVAYSAFNAPASWTWGDGVAYSRTWDEYLRPKTYPLGHPGGAGNSAGVRRTVTYDDAARISAYTHANAAGVAQPAFDQTFAQDGLDRVTQATQGATNYGYSYDATGNRSAQTVGAASYTHTVSPTSNRLASIQRVGSGGATVTNAVTYDAAGNTLTNGKTTATYSDRGRLRTVVVPNGTGTATVTYLYNGLEQRTRKSGPTAVVPTGAAYYAYDEAGHVLGEYDASAVPVYEVIWLNDTPIGVVKQTRTGSGATLNVQTRLDFVYADHLDTPRVIARGSPSTDHRIVWRWDGTEPFGVTAANENPNGAGAYSFNLRFPGQVFDRESAQHYNWHRDYEAWVGRYVQSDPIGLAGGINTYAYALNQPTKYTDPDGRLVFLLPLVPVAITGADIAIGAAIGIGAYAIDRWMESRSRGKSDPVTLPPVNPGRDCDGKCNPCPPGARWFVPRPGHGHDNGYWHEIRYNQDQRTCMCYPDRPSRGLDGM